ncbi:hypothetical protein GH714_041552 [Hevea brasiliensis]|uniref:AAA+ ATPase domain-containing protein n=1 Tax=Hevea brasiliensis TaxID=3981 RepID=A0A6A6MQZ7_HEVBR|nr:hypothetical protein GH714_041552 [Hevea brasiliensis]
MLTQLGSAIGGLLLAWAMFERYFPLQLRRYVDRYGQKLVGLFYPYLQITFHEYTGDRFRRSEVYSAIQSYLSANSSERAQRLMADAVKGNQSVLLTMDDHEEITDDFNGIQIWWASRKNIPKTQSFSFYPELDDRRYFRLTRKLYTNNSSKWNHVVFEHPATFDTLAMATKKKQEVKNDLIKFSKGKDYYTKIGKAWKRGYLLYGPPGTGKSTMIAAMANFLNYDVYDLELTTVKDNSELRKLLIQTTGEGWISIEMSYCCFEAFKILAQNYLDIESHELFAKIGQLLEETKMSPADVAENLMPKSDDEDEETCLKKLIAALETIEEEAKLKEARKKSEEDANSKTEQELKEKDQLPKEDERDDNDVSKEIKDNGLISNGKKETSL